MFYKKNVLQYVALLTSIFFCLMPLASHASISISPAYLHVDLNKKNPSGTFTISNLSNSKQTYRAKAIYFELTEDGSIKPIKPDEYSLAKWIKFNPKEFSLPAGSSRKVRFSIINRGKLKPHEYRGAIEFTPLSSASYSAKGDDGKEMEFKVVTKVLVPIYGTVDGTSYTATLSSVETVKKKDRTGVSVMIDNTGDGVLRLSGEFQLLDKQSKELKVTVPISKVVVFPQSKRKLVVYPSTPIASGTYKAVVHLKEKREEVEFSTQGEISL